jgi:hypothetical protein
VRVRRFAAAGLTAVAMLAIPATGHAQTAEEDSVSKRARPDFDPIGIELDELLGKVGLVSRDTIAQKSSGLSSFVVFPSFGIAAEYDSNIFLTRDGAEADRKLVYSPGVSISSDWESHSLSFSFSSDIARYRDNKSENYEDAQGQITGKIDILDNQSFSTVMGVARRHESRGSEDDPSEGFDPKVSLNYFSDSSYSYEADALSVKADLKVEYQDYLSSPGVDNDSQDITIYDYKVRFGYEFTPGTTFFVEPNGDFRRFDQKVDATGLLQDNESFGTLFGMTIDASGVTFLEFGAGFTTRSYDESSFKSQTNLDFTAKLVWNPTDLLTLNANAGRSTAESSTPGESGVLTSSYSLGLDYAFLDNIVLGVDTSYTQGDNQEQARIDNDYALGLSVDYFVNENWSAKMSVTRSWRSSSTDSES